MICGPGSSKIASVRRCVPHLLSRISQGEREKRRRSPGCCRNSLRRASEQTLLIEREACSRASVQQCQGQSYSGYRAKHSNVEE